MPEKAFMTTGQILRRPTVLALLVSEFISQTGSRMTLIAIPWFVLQTTGSASRMGLTLAAELLGSLIFGTLLSGWTRRLSTRGVLLACDFARAPLILAIPLLHALDALPFALLLALVAAIGAFLLPFEAAQQIALHQTCDGQEDALTKANGLLVGVYHTAGMCGPLLVAVVIAAGGASLALVVDGLSYVVGGLLVLGLMRSPAGGESGDLEEHVGADGVKSALVFICGTTATLLTIGGAMIVEASFRLILGSLVVIAQDLGHGPSYPGVLLGAEGAGAVAGSIALLLLTDRVSSTRLMVIGLFAHVVPVGVLALGAPLSVSAVAFAISGAFGAIFLGTYLSMLVTRSPEDMRTAFLTTVSGLLVLAPMIGIAIGGFAIDVFGVMPTVLFSWIVAVLASFVMASGIVRWVRMESTGHATTQLLATADPSNIPPVTSYMPSARDGALILLEVSPLIPPELAVAWAEMRVAEAQRTLSHLCRQADLAMERAELAARLGATPHASVERVIAAIGELTAEIQRQAAEDRDGRNPGLHMSA